MRHRLAALAAPEAERQLSAKVPATRLLVGLHLPLSARGCEKVNSRRRRAAPLPGGGRSCGASDLGSAPAEWAKLERKTKRAANVRISLFRAHSKL